MLKQDVQQSYAYLEASLKLIEAQSDLTPNNQLLNKTLTNLVEFVTQHCSSLVSELTYGLLKKHDQVKRFQNISARAEYYLELFFADLINSQYKNYRNSNSFDQLYSFPYFNNYLLLGLVEYEKIYSQGMTPTLFIGGGSLPLSPMVYLILEVARRQGEFENLRQLIYSIPENPCENIGLEIAEVLRKLKTNQLPQLPKIYSIDKCPIATDKSSQVIQSLGLENNIVALTSDGSSIKLPDLISTVVIASLAEPKNLILSNIALQSDCKELLVLLRSVPEKTLRELFYPSVNQEIVNQIGKAMNQASVKYFTGFTPPINWPLINSFELYKIKRN